MPAPPWGWARGTRPPGARRVGGSRPRSPRVRGLEPGRGRFLTGRIDEELGVKDVAWLSPAGTEMGAENWSDGNARCLGVLLDGRAQETGIRRLGTIVDAEEQRYRSGYAHDCG